MFWVNSVSLFFPSVIARIKIDAETVLLKDEFYITNPMLNVYVWVFELFCVRNAFAIVHEHTIIEPNYDYTPFIFIFYYH